MSRHGVPIDRIFGTSINLDDSWFLIVGLMTRTLAESNCPADFPGWIGGEYWLIGFAAAILLFAGILIHGLRDAVVDCWNRKPGGSPTDQSEGDNALFRRAAPRLQCALAASRGRARVADYQRLTTHRSWQFFGGYCD
jgi:hypothetical protein